MPDDPFSPEQLEQQRADDHQMAREVLDAERSDDVPLRLKEEQQQQEGQQQQQRETLEQRSYREYAEEREARQRAETELQQWRNWQADNERRARQQEQQRPRHDPYLQPGEYIDEAMQQREQMLRAQFQQQLQPMAQTVQILAARAEFAEARAQYGDETAERAYKEFDKLTPQLPQHEALQVLQAPNRFVAAVQWYKRRETLAALGDDPLQFESRMRERLLADPDFRRQVMSQGRSEPPPQFDASPPRDAAGRFVERPRQPQPMEALPSVNRSGSAKSAQHDGYAGYGSQSDMDLVEEILSAPEPSRR